MIMFSIYRQNHTTMDHLFVGQIVHTKSISEFEIFVDGFVAVQDGEVHIYIVKKRLYIYYIFF